MDASPGHLHGVTVLDFSTVGPAARCSRSILEAAGFTAREIGALRSDGVVA
jgi:hypothetical protein